MSEQIFVSYRREGGDVTAKLICEALKNRGYTVFYDYDSISGGYFDDRIIKAIEECDDFVLVLPKNALDRCTNEDDWVRQEITCALKHGKNIIPILAPDFVFPKELPKEIEDVRRINGIQFIMAYFEAVMESLVDRLISESSLVSAPPEAEELTPSVGLEFVYENTLQGYSVKMGTCNDIEVVIPREYNGKKVVAIADQAFREQCGLLKVFIPDTVKKIGVSAFNECIMLEEVNIPESVIEIGGWAFYGCTFTNVVIPKNVRSIGKRAFTSCKSLEYFSVDENNTNYCSVDGNLFTKDMKTLVAYAAGKKEESYIIPEGVTLIADSAFSDASALVNVTVPESVNDIGEFGFYKCASLDNITLPRGIKNIGAHCFKYCSALRRAVLPDSLLSIGDSMFNECKALEDIAIPESVTEIGKWAFFGCEKLTKIFIPRNVQSIGMRAFTKCTSIRSYSVHSENPAYCAVDGNLYTKDMKTLLVYAFTNPNASFVLPAGVRNIDDSAFSECPNLKEFTASKELVNIADFAFHKCPSLEKVTLSKAMNNIGKYSFAECSRLESIVIPKGISYISDQVFRKCSSLKSATLPKGLLGIGENAFDACEKLEKVNIPDSVTDIGKWAFYGCTSLQSITISKSVKSIGARALAKCTALEAIRTSAFNKCYCSVGKHLYTKDMKTIVAYALASKEVSYVLPDSVKIIDDSAFSHSVNLTNLSLPRDLESIGDFGLFNCAALKQINYKGTVYAWKAVTVGSSVLNQSGTNKITCVDGSVEI